MARVPRRTPAREIGAGEFLPGQTAQLGLVVQVTGVQLDRPRAGHDPGAAGRLGARGRGHRASTGCPTGSAGPPRRRQPACATPSSAADAPAQALGRPTCRATTSAAMVWGPEVIVGSVIVTPPRRRTSHSRWPGQLLWPTPSEAYSNRSMQDESDGVRRQADTGRLASVAGLVLFAGNAVGSSRRCGASPAASLLVAAP